MKFEKEEKEKLTEGGDPDQKFLWNPNVLDILQQTAFSGYQEDSFFLCDPNVIQEKVRGWKSKYPFVKPSFCASTNCNSFVLNTLAASGCQIICKNKEELKRAFECGIDPEQISFHYYQMLVASHIKIAAAKNINAILFRNEGDLQKIAKYAPNASLSLALDFQSEKREIQRLLEKARHAEMTINGLLLEGTMLDLVDLLPTIRFALESGMKLGHFLAPTLHLDLPDIDSFGVNEVELERNLIQLETDLTLSISTGSRLVAEAFSLAARIIGKRQITDEAQQTEFIYVINDGIYSSFGHLMTEESANNLLALPLLEDDDLVYPTQFWGSTMDDLDVLGSNLRDMQEMHIGDWVVFPIAGNFDMKYHENFEIQQNFQGNDLAYRFFYKFQEDDSEDGIEQNLENPLHTMENFSFEDLLAEMLISSSPNDHGH